jgi:hypothetical protein
MNFTVGREGAKTVGTGGWLPPIMRATNHSGIVAACLILLAAGTSVLGDTVITKFTEAELRDAVAAGGRITFSSSGSIFLTQPVTVTNEVLVDGIGAQIQISGKKTTRIFNVETNGILALKNLFVVDGRATSGGAIYNSGSLALFDCFLERNTALGQSSQPVDEWSPAANAAGGAIYSLGGLVVSNCTFTANLAGGGDGWMMGPWAGANGGDGKGGAIYVRNLELLLEIRNTKFLGNQSFGGAGAWNIANGDVNAGGGAVGGALCVENGRVTVENCEFLTNSTIAGRSEGWAGGGVSQGGAIHLKGGQLTAWQSRFHQNSAVGAEMNEARGGAVANQAAFSARECFFSGNSALGQRGGYKQQAGLALGGALYNTSTAVLEANTFLTNQVRGGAGACEYHWFQPQSAEKAKGGAIYNAWLLTMLNNSVISNTSAGGTGGVEMSESGGWIVTNGNDGIGGGLCNQGKAYITNCTFAWNKAQGGLGGKPPGLQSPKGKDGQSVGGGVASLTKTVALYNCLLADNCAGGATCGEAWDGVGGGASSCALYNCTVAGNSAAKTGGGAFASTLDNCIVYFNTAPTGQNYTPECQLNYCCSAPLPANGVGNILGPPLFVSDADFRLAAGSPCIDAGTNLLGCPNTDILGNTRFIDGNGDGKVAWDIGAYEFNSFSPPRFAAPPQLTVDGWKLNVTGAPNKWVHVQKSSNLRDWEDIWSGFMGSEGVKQVNDGDTGQKVMFYRAVVP